MTDRALMQMALEALEAASRIMCPDAQRRQDDAITALRAALAEPERKRRTVKKRLTDDGWKKTREYCS